MAGVRPNLKQLREALADLYDTTSARRVAHDAGLGLERIDLGGSAQEVWYEIINEAMKVGLLDKLVVIAAHEYPAQQARLMAGLAVLRGDEVPDRAESPRSVTRASSARRCGPTHGRASRSCSPTRPGSSPSRRSPCRPVPARSPAATSSTRWLGACRPRCRRRSSRCCVNKPPNSLYLRRIRSSSTCPRSPYGSTSRRAVPSSRPRAAPRRQQSPPAPCACAPHRWTFPPSGSRSWAADAAARTRWRSLATCFARSARPRRRDSPRRSS